MFLLSFAFTQGQRANVDSLKRLLSIHKEDTAKVNTLIYLATALRGQGQSDVAREYAKSAIALSEKTNFKKGKAAALLNIGHTYVMEGNQEEALNYYNLSLLAYRETANRDGIAYSLFHLASAYTATRNYSAALAAFLDAEKYFETSKNRKGIADCYNGLGRLYLAEQSGAEAIKYYFKALAIYEHLKLKPEIATCLVNIGSTYQWQADFKEAAVYIERGLAIWKQLDIKEEIAATNNILGSVYFAQKNYKKALETHLVALEIAHKLEQVSWLLPMTQARLGGDYEALAELAEAAGDTTTAKRRYDEALRNYDEALKANIAQGSKGRVADCNWHFGSVFTKLKKYDVAREYFENALKQYIAIQFTPFIALTHHSIAHLDSIGGDYKSAYKHYRIYMELRDSTLANDEGVRKLAQARGRYEFSRIEDSLKFQAQLSNERLKQEHLLAIQQQQTLQLQTTSLRIAEQQKELNRLAYLRTENELQAEQSQRLEKEKQLVILERDTELEQANSRLKTTQLELKEEEIKARKMQGNVLVAGTFVLLILADVMWQNNKRRQAAKNLLEKQTMRTQIASDLHDEIGSELTSISFYSEMIKMQLREENTSLKITLDRIANNARAIVTTMSDIVWVINPDNDITDNLVMRMRSNTSALCTERNIQYCFNTNNQTGDLKLDMQQRKNLYLIYKEALHNAIKYAECNKISVSLSQSDHEIELMVNDNGKGFDLNEAGEGNGLTNMKRRAEEIRGMLNLHSCRNRGTTISLKVKIN